MSNEQKLSEQFREIQEMGKQNKDVDVGKLMTNALEQSQREEKEQKGARRAYWFSALMPPLGLLVALYYLFSGKPTGKRVALYCTLITLGIGLATWLFLAALLASVDTSSLEQIANINVADYQKEMLGE